MFTLALQMFPMLEVNTQYKLVGGDEKRPADSGYACVCSVHLHMHAFLCLH